MSEEDLEVIYARAEMEYEMLKDRVHDQYDEIQELKNINEKLSSALTSAEETIDKAIEYIKENTDNTNFIEVPSKELLEILGDKE